MKLSIGAHEHLMSKHVEGPKGLVIKGMRLAMILSNSLAMAFAWILLFGTKHLASGVAFSVFAVEKRTVLVGIYGGLY